MSYSNRRKTRPWRPELGLLFLATLFAGIGCAGSKSYLYPTARETYDAAEREFGDGKWENARLRYEAVIFNFPGSSLVDSAQYQLARCYYEQKEYDLAALEFLRVRKQYRNSDLIDDADYQRIVCLMESAPDNIGLTQDKTAQTVTELRVFKDSHPLSPRIPEADSLLSLCYKTLSQKDYKIGSLYHKMGKYAAAEIYLQGMIDNYLSSPLVPDALYLIGEGKRQLDSLDRAQTYYEKVLYLFPEAEITGKAQKRIRSIEKWKRLAGDAEPDSIADNDK